MISDSSDACNYKGKQEADKTTQKQKGECFMRKLLLSVFLCFAMVMGLLPTATFALELGNAPWSVEKAPTSALKGQTVKEEPVSEYGEQKNAPRVANLPTQNDATDIYVSSTGNDAQNTGTKDLPFATLAKAVDAAADGATIYVMSDLTMDQCARFYDKSLKITSGEGGPFTITRSAGFNRQSDTARSGYNPAMIEVQSSSASSVGLLFPTSFWTMQGGTRVLYSHRLSAVTVTRIIRFMCRTLSLPPTPLCPAP